MKNKVIEFFQNLPESKHKQFNDAFELYRNSEGKNQGVERSLNAMGYSERNLENLLHDLQQLHRITDVERFTVASVQITEGDEQIADGSIQIAEGSSQIADGGVVNDIDVVKSEVISDNANSDVEATEGTRPDGSHPGTPIDVVAIVEENESLLSEKEDLEFEKAELEEENEALKEEIALRQAQDDSNGLPKIDAKSVRVEFPFLNDKDCPDVFKILVADKITAWNTYLENHADLLKIESGELIATDEFKAEIAASAVAAFDENQKIYDELNAYQETGKILGLHPLFKQLQMQREVDAMTNEELVNYKNSSAKYFSVKKTALVNAEKANNTVKIESIKKGVAEREQILALVNKKLGISAK